MNKKTLKINNQVISKINTKLVNSVNKINILPGKVKIRQLGQR